MVKCVLVAPTPSDYRKNICVVLDRDVKTAEDVAALGVVAGVEFVEVVEEGGVAGEGVLRQPEVVEELEVVAGDHRHGGAAVQLEGGARDAARGVAGEGPGEDEHEEERGEGRGEGAAKAENKLRFVRGLR